MKRTPILRKLAMTMPATLTLIAAAAFGASAQTVSPATGEQVKPLPFILAAVGLIAVILLVVLMVMEQKKKKGGNQTPPPSPGGQPYQAAAQPPAPPAQPMGGQTGTQPPTENQQADGADTSDPQNPAQ